MCVTQLLGTINSKFKYIKIMNTQLIDRTDNIKRASTWVKRFIKIFIVLGLLIVEIEIEPYILYIITFFLIVVILFTRENDLAADNKYLYHIRTSIIPGLTKVKKFEIINMESIKWRGNKLGFWGLLGTKSFDGRDYGIEIIFRDNSSVSLDMSINKKDMDRILKKVKQIIINESA